MADKTDKTLGQNQGDQKRNLPGNDAGTGGIGQPESPNPDQPATQGVDHVRPDQQRD
ncbi:hypothetical protein HHL28_07100 [Aerophototrophica crusticola]|uniref:Uncharacterized protein n=1 Tax=Aerophototrophica crusticola TaxID=1709002 RepID=A0A858R632_9PROT|nr:hypothetical protein HHL28_07100 [Rhodospirillaceae bacterium B3]